MSGSVYQARMYVVVVEDVDMLRMLCWVLMGLGFATLVVVALMWFVSEIMVRREVNRRVGRCLRGMNQLRRL